MITNMEKTNKLRATPADRFEDDVDVEAAKTICGVETNAGEAVGVLNFAPRKKPSKFLRASGGQGFVVLLLALSLRALSLSPLQISLSLVLLTSLSDLKKNHRTHTNAHT